MRSRYRTERGRTCIDVRLRTVRQLFDLRDPAPFRERDLDPGAAEHLMTSLHEIPRARPVTITLFLTDAGEAIDLESVREAFRGHFEHERALVDDAIRANFRQGRHLALLGIVVLALFLSLARLSGQLLPADGFAHDVLREGLVITGWVAMWRPIEVLLYDWWPLVDKRRWIDKMLACELHLRHGTASVGPAP